MKIMHLLKHGVRGNGHVHVAVDLACTQADAGHEVVFVSSGGSYDGLLTEHGVEVVTIAETGGFAATANSTRQLLSATRRSRPDIIHAHMMSSAVLGWAVGRALRIPLVTTMHNSFEKHSSLMRLGRVVVAVSEAERRLLLSRHYRGTKVVTILNGADGSPREALTPDDLGVINTPCVLTLSGLHKRKAVGDVISAFSQVSAEFPQWHLNIVGWGPDREALEQQVDSAGLSSSVHFLGATLNPRPLLESADIFATATLADPCPLTVTEARAAGCAVVGTAVGGIPELLENGAAGWLTPPSDPSSMAVAFRALMADEQVLSAWQRRAERGADYFTVSRMTQDYLKLYQSLLSRYGRRVTMRPAAHRPIAVGRPRPVATTPVEDRAAR